ncbi:MAG: hypothetical protein KAF40_04010 [Flavihumibacter sp.]|nr:hypothetical protein [Flavihumibacter sp.]
MHKANILAQLQAKYPGVAKAILELVADKLAQTVTEETAIEGAISELEKAPIGIKEYGDLLQREGDRRVTEAQKKFKSEKSDDPNPPNPGADPKDKGDDSLKKMLEQLTAKIDGLEKRSAQQSLSEQLNKRLTDKKIPLQLAKGRLIESPDQLDTIEQEIEADYAAMKQELANQGFAETPKPGGGGSGGDASQKTVEADIKAWAAASQPKPAEAVK